MQRQEAACDAAFRTLEGVQDSASLSTLIREGTDIVTDALGPSDTPSVMGVNKDGQPDSHPSIIIDDTLKPRFLQTEQSDADCEDEDDGGEGSYDEEEGSEVPGHGCPAKGSRNGDGTSRTVGSGRRI